MAMILVVAVAAAEAGPRCPGRQGAVYRRRTGCQARTAGGSGTVPFTVCG